MKRLIIAIPPIIAFVIFVYFYNVHVEHMELEKQRLAAEAKVKAAEEAERKAVLQKAADLEAQRIKEETAAKVAAEKERIKNEKEEQYRKIIAETEAANATSKRLQAQIVKLQADIQAVRAARDKAQATAMETKLDLEKARVDKRNAEFEIQRFTDMLANRMAQSQALTNEVLANAKKK